MPFQDHGIGVSKQIYSLFSYLDTQTYDKVAPKIEYWTEWALTQRLTTVDKLSEHVSTLPWTSHPSPASCARFLKEFRDSPGRSDQAKSFVNDLSTRVFWWFAAASAEDLGMNENGGAVARNGGRGFIEVASFVGHLIECDLLDHKLVRLHLIKPLTTHYYPQHGKPRETVRINAICRLFAVAGGTLVQGLLEPEDVQACFKILETQLSKHGTTAGLSRTKLEELRKHHATWLHWKYEEEQKNVAETGERGAAAGIPLGIETPMSFTPRDLPTRAGSGMMGVLSVGRETVATRSSIIASRDGSASYKTEEVLMPCKTGEGMGVFVMTEFDVDIGEGGGRIPTRHETFYLEDGNVEIVCGHTIFRVHSTVVSFSSPNLRNMLSSSTLLNAPMPEGCPRVVFKDSAEDFAVLLKIIYTPGFPSRSKVPEFTVFASLLRMTTKYGFSDIREALVEDLKAAYPTKWNDFETAKVLGEGIFGSAQPHPNAVLRFFLEQRIMFALPFAAYRAGLGGPSALASERPCAVLPRQTLASIINGMGGLRRAMTHTAHTIAHTWDLGICANKVCALNVGINPPKPRMEVLEKISDVLIKNSGGDMLSALSLGHLLCADCARRLENSHRDCRRQFVWARLPSLLGWESWESIS